MRKRRLTQIFRRICFLLVLLIVPWSLTGIAQGEYFDWRYVEGENWNSSVKEQFWGTCWAFGPMAAFEAKYKLTRNDPNFELDLSEEQLVVETNPMDFGKTIGGSWSTALQPYTYFQTHGIVLEEELPGIGDEENGTHPQDVGLWPLADGWEDRVVKSVSCASYPYYFEAWKEDLKKYGPRTLALNNGGHIVSLVGYRDDPNLPGGGYCIYKNSWGTGFEDDGYGIVYYNDPGLRLDDSAWLTGAVYYTGELASATWNGGAGTWTVNGTNWNSGAYAWENAETNATFGGTGGLVAISGQAIAHGVTINSGSTGYIFNGDGLTVTAGGITANESLTIHSPLTVGAPQAWNVAGGKTLTTGDVHTVISNLTITGSGNTTITGVIDGGGVINRTGADPGNLIKTGTGTLALSGSADYSGTINALAGTINFAPGSGVTSRFTGVISGSATIQKTGAGTTILEGDNIYTSTTTISGGALQADLGMGITNNRFLSLDGGVLQSNSTINFTRSMGTGGTAFQWTLSGGGFSAGAGAMTVRIGNNTNAVSWGTSGNVIKGTLKFGSESAGNVVDFQNGINLNSGSRTIEVRDNVDSNHDWAVVSGVISNSTGTGNLTKSGDGILKLTATNTYNGTTTIGGGVLEADFGTGIPTSSFLTLDGGVLQSNGTQTFTRSLGTSGNTFRWTAGGGGFSANGGPMTVNIGNGTNLTWGNTVGSQLVGPLKFGSQIASDVTTFQNSIDLGGGDRTIHAVNNPDSSSDYAVLTGALSGTGSLTKTGDGVVYLQGNSSNTYSGDTTITSGKFYLNKTSGYAIPGNLNLIANDANCYVLLEEDSQIAPTAMLNFVATPTTSSRLSLLGHDQTVAGISCTTGRGVIQNLENESISQNGTFTVNNMTDCYYDGYMRDKYQGSGTGTLALAKNGTGTLTLAGESIYYTGGTTIDNGKLVLTEVTDSTFLGTNFTNDATLELNYNANVADYNGVISGSGDLLKTGLSTVILSGSSGNTYTGDTITTGGMLRLNKSSGYAIGGNLNITGTDACHTYVYLDRDNQIDPSSVMSFTHNASGYSRFVMMGHDETLGGISCSDGRGIVEHTEYESGVTNNGVLTINNTADYVFNGHMRDRRNSTSIAKLALVKTGSGTQTLSGGCIYHTGGTTVNGGKLVLENTTHSTFRSTDITNNAAVEFATTSSDISFNGTISGTGDLHKTGSRKLTLSSASNSYSGDTIVSGGLLAASSTAVPGDITIDSGGAFSPGTSVGFATTGEATWNGGGQYLFEINDADATAGTGWDLWSITGDLSIDSMFTIDVDTLSGSSLGTMADFDNTLSYSWLLAQATGTISGFTNLALDISGFQNVLASEGQLYLSQSGNDSLYLNYTPTTPSMPGDANGDGRVDGSDVTILANHWQHGVTGIPDADWSMGDFNGDGRVDGSDVTILANHWQEGTTSTAAAVPEPGSVKLIITLLVMIGGISIFHRSGKQRNLHNSCK